MVKKKLVVLSGAGISAESGLATFRDGNGLWENYKIEEVATPEAWHKNPELVNRFYNMRRKQVIEAQPNAAHFALAELESDFDVHIITQNIDDLHERAGSKNVLHLHGEILKMRCEYDETDIQPIYGDITAHHISKLNRRMRPHIVWFGESVPELYNAALITQQADLFVIIGTSLNVYPAAGLIHDLCPSTPIYIIDKKIPHIPSRYNITSIEMRATEGVNKLKEMLK